MLRTHREGILTVAVGILLCILYPRDPTETSIFTPQERELALRRLAAGALDGKDETNDRNAKMPFSQVVKIIFKPSILASGGLYIANNITMQGLISFMP